MTEDAIFDVLRRHGVLSVEARAAAQELAKERVLDRLLLDDAPPRGLATRVSYIIDGEECLGRISTQGVVLEEKFLRDIATSMFLAVYNRDKKWWTPTEHAGIQGWDPGMHASRIFIQPAV
jgi:hypothetical protein